MLTAEHVYDTMYLEITTIVKWLTEVIFMKNITLSIAVVSLMAFSVMTATMPVSAAENTPAASTTANDSISIPITSHVRGDAGSEHTLATKTVANGEYTVKVVARNQGSIHPNSDIIVRSGTSSVSVLDVERISNSLTNGDGKLTVADGKVVVSLKLGADKVFSGGVDVVLTPVPAAVVVPVAAPTPVAAPAPVAKPVAVAAPVATLPSVGPNSALIGFTVGIATVLGSSFHYLVRRYTV